MKILFIKQFLFFIYCAEVSKTNLTCVNFGKTETPVIRKISLENIVSVMNIKRKNIYYLYLKTVLYEQIHIRF